MRSISLIGMRIHVTTTAEVIDYVTRALTDNQGSYLLTANLDILRIFTEDEAARRLYDQADLCIADGMPLVWASRLSGEALPERIPGSTLSEQLLECCHAQKKGVFLLGGTTGTAEKAAELYREKLPSLSIEGNSSLVFSMPPSTQQVESACAVLENAPHDLVLVGLGSPKQEALIVSLKQQFPQTTFVGVGGTFSFLSGTIERAPSLLQKLGLEWLFRLSREPKRLATRYLVKDLPVLVPLMMDAVKTRFRRRAKKK